MFTLSKSLFSFNPGRSLPMAASMCLATALAMASSNGLAGHGTPFDNINEELAELNAELSTLSVSVDGVSESVDALEGEVSGLTNLVNDQQMANMPADVTVNCAAGESINSVLEQYASSYARLTITVEGSCSEVVILVRDNVTIQGGPAAVIASSDPGSAGLNISRGASHVVVRDITLSGGLGILITRNAQAVLHNVEVTQSVNGILALESGTATAENSRIYGNTRGVVAQGGSQVVLINSTIENNTVGMFASNNGIVQLTSRGIDGTIGSGTVVRNNNTGFAGQSGGRLMLTDASFESNAGGVGIYMHTSASAHFLPSVNGQGNVISGFFFGVYAFKNTSVLFSSTENEFSSNSFAIQCNSPDTSYWTNGAPLPGTFNNNLNGDVVGCTGF